MGTIILNQISELEGPHAQEIREIAEMMKIADMNEVMIICAEVAHNFNSEVDNVTPQNAFRVLRQLVGLSVFQYALFQYGRFQVYIKPLGKLKEFGREVYFDQDYYHDMFMTTLRHCLSVLQDIKHFVLAGKIDPRVASEYLAGMNQNSSSGDYYPESDPPIIPRIDFAEDIKDRAMGPLNVLTRRFRLRMMEDVVELVGATSTPQGNMPPRTKPTPENIQSLIRQDLAWAIYYCAFKAYPVFEVYRSEDGEYQIIRRLPGLDSNYYSKIVDEISSDISELLSLWLQWGES